MSTENVKSSCAQGYGRIMLGYGCSEWPAMIGSRTHIGSKNPVLGRRHGCTFPCEH